MDVPFGKFALISFVGLRFFVHLYLSVPLRAIKMFTTDSEMRAFDDAAFNDLRSIRMGKILDHVMDATAFSTINGHMCVDFKL
jgi:hypothetical protein